MRGAAEILRGAGAKLASLRPRRPATSRRRGSRAALAPRRRRRGSWRGSARRPHGSLSRGSCSLPSAGSPTRRPSVQSDVTKLVPSNMPALRDLHTLENVTGVSGEIDVIGPRSRRRHADRDRLDDPLRERAAQRTSATWRQRAAGRRRCARRCRCPICSRRGRQSARPRPPPSTSDINALLAAVPGYFSQAVITPDHREARRSPSGSG